MGTRTGDLHKGFALKTENREAVLKMADKTKRIKAAIHKELLAVQKQEKKLAQAAQKKETSHWREEFEKKIPSKTLQTLEQVFCKAFSVIFEKGTGVIEKSYNKEAIGEDFEIQDYAAKVKGNRKELRKIKGTVQKSGIRDMAITTAEGIGLGLLGIGLPDIVVFVGMLLRGIYETALHYGIDYNTSQERYLILKMMEAALAKGEDWQQCNHAVDALLIDSSLLVEKDVINKADITQVEIAEKAHIQESIEQDSLQSDSMKKDTAKEQIKEQIDRTASAFAVDMLLLKFVQGIPIVGILGGAGNPVYYHKILRYVKLKYQKRYLLTLQQEYTAKDITDKR